MRRSAAVAAGVPVAIMGMGLPAYAYEGTFSSYIDDAVTGFESRWWQDNNSTNDDTIVTFKGCRVNNNSTGGADAGIALRWSRPYLPDGEGSTVVLNCYDSDNYHWADPAATNYRFRLKTINGSDSGRILDVETVGVSW
ncbi:MULTISPECIES: hypothetical protein [Parafrankia]|uniref:hypothetical protein n=1 Tax=Parafrankia TaxID=2994362 RepID=UPI001041C7AD|nr:MULTISPECIES: hypothetical protein [Parafrankia]MBE3203809.1 hypothetical protein [Parafrankia sp. CH37]